MLTHVPTSARKAPTEENSVLSGYIHYIRSCATVIIDIPRVYPMDVSDNRCNASM